jgi:hypothetical protein
MVGDLLAACSRAGARGRWLRTDPGNRDGNGNCERQLRTATANGNGKRQTATANGNGKT